MCAISVSNCPSIAEAMMRSQIERGPDGWCLYADKGGHNVGFVRLKIVGDEMQPVKVGKWVVWINGYISNWQELEPGATDNDVWVGGRWIEKNGIESIKDFRGFFSLVAIYDHRIMYAARDVFGIKPLYFWKNGNETVISSTCKAILTHPEYRRGVDLDSLENYLICQRPAKGQTLFKDINEFSPGTIYNITEGTKKKFSEIKLAPQQMFYDHAAEGVRELTMQAVKRNLHPSLGAWISGGIDSPLLALLAKPEFTFCAGHRGEGDERPYAQETARLINSDHRGFCCGPLTIRDSLAPTIEALEDLNAAQSYVNYCLYRVSAKKCKVLLQGTGADELFMGYKWRYDLNRPHGDTVFRGYKMGENLKTIEDRMIWDIDVFLPGLLKVSDKLSTACGLEDRPVFLDQDLAEFALTIPIEYKMGKKILIDAFKDVLPESNITRKKQGFCSNDNVWFFNENRAWIEERLNSSGAWEYISQGIYLDAMKQGNTPLIWSLLSFDQWLRLFIHL